jgi:hypothetical protein
MSPTLRTKHALSKLSQYQMELFHEAKQILEDELEKFRSFLLENTEVYTFEPADITPIRIYARNIQSKLAQDMGKSFEEIVKSTMIRNWKTIFHADNYIDTGRTLEEQRELIKTIITSIETTGKVSDLPTTMMNIINAEFLDTEYRKSVLLEELRAEYRLTDPSIDWISACLERTRVMYYSVLTVVKCEVIRSIVEKLYAIAYDRKVEAFENIFTKEEIDMLLREAILHNAIPEKEISQTDGLCLLARSAVVVSVTDDFMDLEEDLENDKRTGITCGQKIGISPSMLMSTVIQYMETIYSDVPQIRSLQLWFRELVILAYQDSQKCIETCREISPYLFTYFFQRK